MKNKIILLSVVLLLFSGAASAQKQTASAFVESFYKFHRARTRPFNAREVNLHKKWFTPELNQLFQNELKREKEYLKKNPGNKPYFGDGFSMAPLEECSKNGKEIKNVLKIGAVTANENKTLVEVKFSSPKVCGVDFTTSYKVELVKNRGVWLINDLIYENGKTLTGDLNRAEY